MGGLPLLVALPLTIRSFTRAGHGPASSARRLAVRPHPAGRGARTTVGLRRGLVDELERLEGLHQRGSITDEEYDAAKRKLLGKDPW